MELGALAGVVLFLVLTGMVLGTGILVLDKFGSASRDSITVTDNGVNLTSGSATLSQTYCTKITSVKNITDATFDISTYNVTITNEATCAIEADLPVSYLYNVTYKYGASNTAVTTMSSVITAITPVASTWLPLVVTVMVLSVILVLVIRSFAVGSDRQ